MEQLTPTQRPSSCLVLLLTVSFLAAACSPNVKALPEPRVHASIAPGSIQQGTEVVAALVTAQKANLRRSPSISAAVAMVLNKGTLLTVLEPSPVGPWYQVRDSKTDTEGWIHGNAIALLQTIGTAATPRDGRTEQAEDTERGQDARASELRITMVNTECDQVRADQAIGREAADSEAGGQ